MKRAVLVSLLWVLAFSFPWWGRTENFTACDNLYQTTTLYRADSVPYNEDLIDSPIEYLPVEMYMSQALKQGRMAFWNPLFFAGVPIFSDGWSGYFYPPRILLMWLFPMEIAWHLSLFGHLCLSGLAAYGLARQRGLNRDPALLCATLWMFNGPCMTWFELDFMAIFNLWLPFCLWSVRHALSDRRWVGAAALGIMGLLTCGHLQWAFYSCLVIVGDCLWGLRGRGKWSWGRALCCAGLGLCLSSPMLLPSARHMSDSQRSDRSAEFLQSSYRQFLKTAPPTLCLPDAWGTPVNGFEFRRVFGYGNFVYPELCIFCGNVALLLALLGLLAYPAARRWTFVALLLTLIPITPVYAWVASWGPGMTKIVPTRLGWLYCLALTVLAGLGMQAWQAGRLTARHRQIAAGLALGLALAICAWVVFMSGRAPELSRWMAAGEIRLPDAHRFSEPELLRRAVQTGFSRTYSWTSPSVWPHMLTLLLFPALILCGSPRARQFTIALAGLELLFFGMRFNPTLPGPFYPDNPVARKVGQRIGGDRCIGLATILPNQFSPFGVPTLEGYDSFYPATTARVMGHLSGQPPQNPRLNSYGRIERPQSPWINLLNVGYILALPEQGKPVATWQELDDVAPMVLYRNPGRLERVRVVGQTRVETDPQKVIELIESGQVDPRTTALVSQELAPLGGGGEARISSYQPEKVEIEAETRGRALVVLADAFAPGWSVRVDGRECPVVRSDVMLRAVVVETAGSHHIVFSYRPPGFDLGLKFAALALVLSGLAWLIPIRASDTPPSVDRSPPSAFPARTER